MRRMSIAVTTFLICLLVFLFRVSWGAECFQSFEVPSGGTSNGRVYLGTPQNPIPESLAPGIGCSSGYLKSTATNYPDNWGCGGATPVGWINVYPGWNGYWYWAVPTTHQCYPWTFDRYYVDYDCTPAPPAGYDYDCDGLQDSEDPNPGILDEDPEGGQGVPKTCNTLEGNPVNVMTGNKYEEVLDLSVSTPGIPLEFRRSYNSRVIHDGKLGYGWTHNFNLSLEVLESNQPKRVVIRDGDGRALYFTEYDRTGSEILFSGESGVKDRLKQVISTGECFLRRKDGNLTYEFNSGGSLVEISDPNGNTLILTYTSGNLTQVSNNFGKALSIQYSNGRISTVTDSKSQSIEYDYSNGNLTEVTYPDQNSIGYGYNNQNHPHFLTDKYDTDDNLIGHWDYDTWGRVTTYYSHLKDSVPQERIDFSYESPGTLLTRSTGVTTYTTSVVDRMKVINEIEGCSTCGSVHKRFEYSDRLDLTDLTAISDSVEHTTHYTYDDPANPWDQVGEILTVTEALGLTGERTTSYTYTHRQDDPFILTESTETKPSVLASQQNKVITIDYDTQGKVTSREEAGYTLISGTPTSRTYTTAYQYNSYGQLTQINGPRTDLSDITTLEYYDNDSGEGNNRGQLMTITNALNQSTSFSNYDANGNVGTITDPNGVAAVYTYDERNRVATITNQTTSAEIQYFYNSHGMLDHVILPEGMQITFTYNPADKVVEIYDNLGNKIVYDYDVEGNRTGEDIKDPQNTLKKYLDFTYDAYNRLKRIVNPDSTYTEFTYNGFGDRTAIRDPRANTTSYAYDALNRLDTMTQSVTLDSQLVQSVTDYDADTHDNLIQVTDPKQHATHYVYDDFGRRNKTSSPDTQTTSYSYDQAGNMTQKTDANGTAVTYTYDALNRLTAVQFPNSAQNITYTYDSTSVTYGIGRLTGRTDPSGTYVFYYDAHGNLTKEEKTIASVLYTTQYGYNKDNVLISITYPTGRVITYTIDTVDRVSQVSTTLSGNAKTLASSITYLPFGGITGLTYGNNLTLVRGYDNQYRTSTIVVGSLLDRTYGYDANGNVTSTDDNIEPTGDVAPERTRAYSYESGTNLLAEITGEDPKSFDYDNNANTTQEGSRVHVYDASDQLITVSAGGNTIAQYVYNGAGQRIKKIVSSTTRIFHYDLPGHIIAETNSSGQMLVEYVYLGNDLLAMIRPGETEAVYYYHNDHLGTPQILTNASGNVAWKATYPPFGEAEILLETVENPFRLPGQYYDQETGLHYNYFRYYNPGTGRYVTTDPIGLAGGINLWPYTGNNPVNFLDPLGLTFCASQALVNCIINAEGSSNSFVSGAGATGRMQVTNGAVSELRRVGVLGKNEQLNLTDPKDNIRAGTLYLNYLLNSYQGDVIRTVAAYTAGTGNVAQYGPPIFTPYYKNGYLQPANRFPNSNAYVNKVLDCLEQAEDAGVSCQPCK
jgi:RHS repeat-associated protein